MRADILNIHPTIAIDNFARVIGLDRIIQLQSIIYSDSRDPHIHKNTASFVGDRVRCANGVAALNDNRVETALRVDIGRLL